jgi:uncharacterized BrkB/YihY/UPF0761 family membrane protein
LPGVLYVYIASELTSVDLVQKDILAAAFLYYFIGLIISRIGSTIVEPLLKKLSFIKFAEYKDYVKASQKDPKIEILSEANNMYRTIISLFLTIGLTMLYSILVIKHPDIKNWLIAATILSIFTMFLVAYRKQTNYITKRIKSNLE